MKKINKTIFLSLSLLLVGCNRKDDINSTNNNETSDIIDSSSVSNGTNSTTESLDSTTNTQNSSSSIQGSDSSTNIESNSPSDDVSNEDSSSIGSDSESNSSTNSGSDLPSNDGSSEDSSSVENSDSSNIENDSSTNGDFPTSGGNNNYIYFERQIKLYINPSVQYSNTYANNLGNEGVYMNSISKILVGMLNKYTNLVVYSNTSLPGKSLSESVKESNNLKVDYHLAIHSNAGGGKGSEGFYTKSSYGFTKSILDSMDKVLPYKTRGAKYGQNELYELKNTTASASLIEILFHDDKSQALFIINNQQSIAKAIFDGIVSYLS